MWSSIGGPSLFAKRCAQRQGLDFDIVFCTLGLIWDDATFTCTCCAWWLGGATDRCKISVLQIMIFLRRWVQQQAVFVDPDNKAKVPTLCQALYGLRHASHAWNARLDASLVSFGFKWSVLEHVVCQKGKGESQLLIGVYVDDLIASHWLVCRWDHYIQGADARLFDMSDLGLLSYYLEFKSSKWLVRLLFVKVVMPRRS